VDVGDNDPFATTAARARGSDDPFERALRGNEAAGDADEVSVDRTVTLVGPLAARAPALEADESIDLQLAGAASFDEVLSRARRRGFLAGCAAGTILAAAAAALLATGATGTGEAASEPRPGPPREGRGTPEAAPEPAPPAVSAASGALASPPAGAAGPRAPRGVARKIPREGRHARAAATIGGEGAAALPGLDLRAAVPAAAPGGPERRPAGGAVDADAAEPTAPRLLGDGEVSAALEARRDALDGCAAAVVSDAVSAAGRRFMLLVAIDPDGKVAEARIDDPAIHATALGGCLVRIARDMSFAPFDGAPVRVELPLRFGSGDGEPRPH
jgi:hypothetical protein